MQFRLKSKEQQAGVVVAALALPPPVTGQTTVNAGVVEELRKHAIVRLELVDTSPQSHKRSIGYHLLRLRRITTVPLVLLKNTSCTLRRFYTVVDAGKGMYYTFGLVILARVLRYRVFLHHHSSAYIRVRDRRFAALSFAAGVSSVHVVLSDEMAQELRGRYGGLNAIVSHNACYIKDGKGRSIARHDAIVTIGFLSNLSLEKGLDLVIEAFGSVRARGINARLVLAGPTMDDRAADLIKDAKTTFGESITVMGSVAEQAKEAFFLQLDLFLFPSRYRNEAQPMVILEALSYGVAVIAIRHGYIGGITDPLGTTVGEEDFVAFVTDFAGRMIWDQKFAHSQKKMAYERFIELHTMAKDNKKALLELLHAH